MGVQDALKKELHVSAVKAMLAMAPRRSCNDVFSVFADGISCSDILKDDGIGLINARLLAFRVATTC